MKTFWDLPKPVRERIHRLHLVAEKQPVGFEIHQQYCGYTEISHDLEGDTKKPAKRKCPNLLQVSRKIEREASPIYFGENAFAMYMPESLSAWKKFTMPRHIRQIRKVALYCWEASSGAPGEAAYKAFNTLPKLEVLTFQVDEEAALRLLLTAHGWKPGHRVISWHSSLDFGPQVNLQFLQCGGISELRSLRGLRQVNFVKDLKLSIDDPGNVGAMPGGF